MDGRGIAGNPANPPSNPSHVGSRPELPPRGHGNRRVGSLPPERDVPDQIPDPGHYRQGRAAVFLPRFRPVLLAHTTQLAEYVLPWDRAAARRLGGVGCRPPPLRPFSSLEPGLFSVP